MVAVVAFIVTAISQNNFDRFAVGNHSLVKSSFNDFIFARVKNSIALGFVISPFTFVQSTTGKLANACAVSFVVFESALVDISAFHADLSLT